MDQKRPKIIKKTVSKNNFNKTVQKTKNDRKVDFQKQTKIEKTKNRHKKNKKLESVKNMFRKSPLKRTLNLKDN